MNLDGEPIGMIEHYEARTKEEIESIGNSRNCDTVYATNTQLMLDLDTTYASALFRQVFPVVCEKFIDARIDATWKSRNKGEHVVIELGEEVTLMEQLVLQSSLGSDPVRSIIALAELKKTGSTIINLFKPREDKA